MASRPFASITVDFSQQHLQTLEEYDCDATSPVSDNTDTLPAPPPRRRRLKVNVTCKTLV